MTEEQIYYFSTVEEAKQCTEDPVLPWYKRLPKCFDDGSQPHQFGNVHKCFRVQYYEIHDLLIGEILTGCVIVVIVLVVHVFENSRKNVLAYCNSNEHCTCIYVQPSVLAT